MIYGLLNQGSGVGNQLHRYIALRIKALQLGVDYNLIWVPDGSGKDEGFKCKGFMKFDENKVILSTTANLKSWQEKKILENGVDIRGYDPEFNFIEDNTVIDGEFQDEKYWEEYEDIVNEILGVDYFNIPDNLCVIGFRGGEFTVFPDLFLTAEYWAKAIHKVQKDNPNVNMRFEVHTDDPVTAKQFFPDYKIIRDLEINWKSMRFAKYAIISNSSFYILPRWLNGGYTIAPRYWARRNTKVWALPQNYYKRFTYI